MKENQRAIEKSQPKALMRSEAQDLPSPPKKLMFNITHMCHTKHFPILFKNNYLILLSLKQKIASQVLAMLY